MAENQLTLDLEELEDVMKHFQFLVLKDLSLRTKSLRTWSLRTSPFLKDSLVTTPYLKDSLVTTPIP
jgi:hypothetical protein